MNTITPDQLTAKLLELAEASPDAVYDNDGQRCMYTEGQAAGRNGCIFGQALMDLGVPIAELKSFEEDASSQYILDLVDKLGIPFVSGWGEVQVCQDYKNTWAESTKNLKNNKDVV